MSNARSVNDALKPQFQLRTRREEKIVLNLARKSGVPFEHVLRFMRYLKEEDLIICRNSSCENDTGVPDDDAEWYAVCSDFDTCTIQEHLVNLVAPLSRNAWLERRPQCDHCTPKCKGCGVPTDVMYPGKDERSKDAYTMCYNCEYSDSVYEAPETKKEDSWCGSESDEEERDDMTIATPR